MNARQGRELDGIAERLAAGDRRLAQRLSRHRLGLCGVGLRHRWLAPALLTLGVLAVSVAGLVLLVAACAGHHGPACLATGTALLVAVPFIPVLLDQRRVRRRSIRAVADPRPATNDSRYNRKSPRQPRRTR